MTERIRELLPQRGMQAGLILVLLLGAQLLVMRPAQAATFTVINTKDSGTGSLRKAITRANINTGPDNIAFNIPDTDPGYSSLIGVWVIQPSTPLPSLSGGGTTIDGHTQTTNWGDTNIIGPEVQLDGSSLAASDWIFSVVSNDNTIKGLAITWAHGGGIKLIAGASYNTISGNVISGNALDGVMISGTGTESNNVKNNIIGLDSSGVGPIANGGHGIYMSNGAAYNSIGGDAPDRNIISGNGGSGVYISGSGTDLNIVWGNYIGTDQSGSSAVGNANSGVMVTAGAKDNGIQDNLISGNLGHGVFISDSGTDNNYVRLNIIGADEQVAYLIPNNLHNVGVYDGASSNWIGTIAPPWGNVIVGAGWSGVALHKSNQNSVLYNAIGTDEAGTATNLGNTSYGVHVEGMQNNIGIGNTIAYNGKDGIRVNSTTDHAHFNHITQNAIYSNGWLGIELLSNGNTELNAPAITKASCELIEGSVCAGCIVEIFSDTAGEGKHYEGTTTANAILPAFSWSGTAFGPNVTATATDSHGNTSEFSAPFKSSCRRLFIPQVVKAQPQGAMATP